MTLTSAPLADGIANFARRLRSRQTSAAAVTEDYLERIDILEPSLGAFEYVSVDEARKTANAVDRLLGAGTDLGPLMGVPVAIKDIIAVADMPIAAGSRLDVVDLIGSEGAFVKQLRRSGCVILGKLKTCEFATGNVGTNYIRGTPRNPWDSQTFRVSSGSSSGSGVAMAADLCGFAIGTDTGGSVRGPAAFCGVVGLKPTLGTWPTDGVLPMSRTFDTIGPLTRSVKDAALVWATLTGNPVPSPADITRIRVACPNDAFFEDLDDTVSAAMEAALRGLRDSGVEIVNVTIPELAGVNELFETIARTEAVATIGRERFVRDREQMNPDVADRIGYGLSITADAYIQSMRRHRDFVELSKSFFRDVDAWVGPTKQCVAPEFCGEYSGRDAHSALAKFCQGPTRAANVLGLCAISQPIPISHSLLPVGFQTMGLGGNDAALIGLGLAFEQILGTTSLPDVSRFAESQVGS